METEFTDCGGKFAVLDICVQKKKWKEGNTSADEKDDVTRDVKLRLEFNAFHDARCWLACLCNT